MFIYLFKIKSKSKFPRKGIYVVEICLDIWHAKCQADISIFSKHIAQKSIRS